ncbi:MAG: hypothetical protein ACM3NZ_13490 [Betaproteobacteria bacterium]|jgi:hypothetical protein
MQSDEEHTNRLDEPKEEARTTRPRFLRQLGVTLATAVGAGILARTAFAAEGQCCRDCDNCGHCGGDSCWCTCQCSSGNYCFTGVGAACIAPNGGCITCPC